MSLSEVLPGAAVTNAALAARFGLHEQWLGATTGNRTRHFCRPDSPEGVPSTTSDLAVAVGAQALRNGGFTAADIDFVVLSTASPDHLMPATVNLVADRLGIDGVPTFQLTSGCAGALQALYTARALLGDGGGGLRRGLVVGGDTCVKMLPNDSDPRSLRPAEMINFAMFGDGAGAAVVEAVDVSPGEGLVVEQMFLRTHGHGRKGAQTVRWYGVDGAPQVRGPRGTTARESMAEEDYKAIEANVPGLAAGVLAELVGLTGWHLAQVEHVLVPQLNGVMTEKIREHLGVRPDQAVSCVAETGNNGNALPFVQLHRAAERFATAAPGERVLVANIESSKWTVAGLALRLEGPVAVGAADGGAALDAAALDAALNAAALDAAAVNPAALDAALPVAGA
ncbi:MAG: 3-oxoacyl-ACP synthase III family protein [Kineosporiaceae bacterium]